MSAAKPRLLMIDNYDSFTYNIVQYFGELGAEVEVFRNDEITVEGTLKDGMTAIDVLKATFPAGTLTGAPKVHAMELIDQLEPTKRGLYGGACGYISYAGDMDVAITIRTGIIKNQVLHVQAAAGVVADSVPELEWRETEAKARALLRASELVEEGLE